MKTLYLECNMGAAGDMLMAALTELMPDKDAFIKELNDLQIPQVNIERTTIAKCGIMGTHMVVTVNGEEEKSVDVPMHAHTHSHIHEEHEHPHTHEHLHSDHEHSHEGHTHTHGHGHHHHTSMKDIEHIIGHLNVPEKVKEDAIAVYKLIADAESHAHGRPVEEVHFHEVGAMDAVADIVGVCLAIYKLAPEQIIASPVHVGYGQIHCAHGILPIPAPATAHILQGVPIYGGRIEGELCTPTGAALLKHFAQSFGQMPMMAVEQTGYGMGMKDFTDANCLRAIIGNTVEEQEQTGCHGAVQEMDSIIELCCNLDDMTPEKIGFVTELLMKEGAFDVYTTNIQMKKNRPAVMLTCMCAKADREKFLTLILKHTTTIGVREYTCKRYGLKREIKEVETIYGTFHVKVASGYGITKEKPEYEDMARIAKEKKISLAEIEKEVYKNLKQLFVKQKTEFQPSPLQTEDWAFCISISYALSTNYITKGIVTIYQHTI